MIQLAVGMAVGIILIVGLIWPVVDDSTDDINTIQYNETNRYSSTYNATMDIIVKMDSNSNLVINDEIIDFNGSESASIVSDKFTCYYDGSALKMYDSNSTSSSVIWINELIITGGNYSYKTTASGESDPKPLTRLIYPDNDGDLGAYSGVSVNVDYDKSVFYGFSGQITGMNQIGVLFVEYSGGSVIFGSTYVYDPTSSTYVDMSSVSSYEPNSYSESEDYYTVDSQLIYNVDGNSGSYAGSIMYAPLEYHIVTDMDSNIRTMIAVAGMLIVVLMVVMVARNLMD